MNIKAVLSRLGKRIKNLPEALREAIVGYQESYHKGVEKFGVWWTVFHLSMWAFIAIFLLAAILMLVIYLPKAEMLNL